MFYKCCRVNLHTDTVTPVKTSKHKSEDIHVPSAQPHSASKGRAKQ